MANYIIIIKCLVLLFVFCLGYFFSWKMNKAKLEREKLKCSEEIKERLEKVFLMRQEYEKKKNSVIPTINPNDSDKLNSMLSESMQKIANRSDSTP